MGITQSHRFVRQGRTFDLDPESLALSEGRPRWFPSRCRSVRRITERMILNRDLEQERVRINASRRQWQDHLYLNVSHACNLACSYCFAQGGSYGGKSEFMSPQIAKAAIDWLLGAGISDRFSINFFGGEPLLNIDAIREAVVHARKQAAKHRKSFRLLISTNGTRDLCELAPVLCTVNHWYTVSIDGPPQIHNRNRPHFNGAPSYDVIAANVKQYISLVGNRNISAKATWRRGQSDLIAVAKDLLGLGLRWINIGRETSVTPQAGQPVDNDYHRDFDEILEAYDDLAAWYRAQLNQGSEVVIQPLQSLMLSILRGDVIRKTCTAGAGIWCVVPDGQIYPCHRYVEGGYSIGHVLDVPVQDALVTLPISPTVKTGMGPKYKACIKTTDTLPAKCHGCWAKFWCFSNNCVYLTSMGQEFRQLGGFCDFMRQFLEMLCMHVADLSGTGRTALQAKTDFPGFSG